ncbi:MAG: alpha/beta hydrolase [Defluviitaleaceae bacterium]|nr:alpha/beta hydrolase [Defluviitaleaceae bacterium]
MKVGQMVNVNGKNMHLRVMGSGGKTVVLMPGWGLPLPTLDFAPLMRDLAEHHTVCTIEFFGYGYSDPIDRPHTNENYMNEIREALTFAGLKPPYVLMPHSCAGVYCEYYATKHPDEVEALILIDTSPTVMEFAETMVIPEKKYEKLLKMKPSKWQEKLIPLYMKLAGERQMHIKAGYTYDELMAIHVVGNHMPTLVAQSKALADNVREVAGLEMPPNIPIVYLSAYNKKIQAKYGKIFDKHMERLGESAKRVVVKGASHLDIFWKREFRKIILEELERL